jgi:hypothetical protein
MRGDLVIVRAFRGMPLVRRIWEEVERGVYITNDACLERGIIYFTPFFLLLRFPSKV